MSAERAPDGGPRAWWPTVYCAIAGGQRRPTCHRLGRDAESPTPVRVAPARRASSSSRRLRRRVPPSITRSSTVPPARAGKIEDSQTRRASSALRARHQVPVAVERPRHVRGPIGERHHGQTSVRIARAPASAGVERRADRRRRVAPARRHDVIGRDRGATVPAPLPAVAARRPRTRCRRSDGPVVRPVAGQRPQPPSS